MLSKNIDTEFLDDFPKKELKENYDWELISVSKDDINKRSVFLELIRMIKMIVFMSNSLKFLLIKIQIKK
jgi:hypothetical protein